jgi:hypothetical protein
MLRDTIIAAIRTGVAVIITYLITWLLGLGVDLDPGIETALNIALFGIAVGVYNFIVSLLERNVNPWFGILLGVPKAPVYGSVGTTTPPSTTGTTVMP